MDLSHNYSISIKSEEQLSLKHTVFVQPLSIIIILVLLLSLNVSGVQAYTPFEKKSQMQSVVGKLAVLPLENRGMQSDDYLATGMTNELIDLLSYVGSLQVIGRTSSFHFHGQTRSLADVRSKLGADYLVIGSVKRALSGFIAVEWQLIETARSVPYVTTRFTEDTEEVFTLLVRIVERIAEELSIELSNAEQRAIREIPTQSSKAFDLYLKGVHALVTGESERAIGTALRNFKTASELDPNFVKMQSTLSVLIAQEYYNGDGWFDAFLESEEALRRAMESAPSHISTQIAKGYNYYYGYSNFDDAIDLFYEALAVKPSNPELLIDVGDILRRQGKWDEALQSYHLAKILDPLNDRLLGLGLGQTALLMRRYQDAEQYYSRAIELAPENPEYYRQKARLYLNWEGSTEKARNVVNDALQHMEQDKLAFIAAKIEMIEKKYRRALQLLETMERSSGYFLDSALIYSLMGEIERAEELYDAARIGLWPMLQTFPAEPDYHALIGIAYAGMGLTDKARGEADLAYELLSIDDDAYKGAVNLENCAIIYTIAEDHDSALDLLEELLAIPSWISVQLLQTDPLWAPLRDNVRFKTLIAQN